MKICISFLLLNIVSVTSTCDHFAGVEAPSTTSSPYKRQQYIVHVKSNHTMPHREWHKSFIPTSSSRDLLYSFQHVISGFAAMLTVEEVECLRNKDGFLHAHPSKTYRLGTTHSPSFLGLEPPTIGNDGRSDWKDVFGYGRGVVIGVIDTGISPTHPSFDDHGMPPPPSRWKGTCEFPVVCNNKIIGAKSFLWEDSDGSGTPVDGNGHGTHTAGIAAGRFVAGASVLGSANGTAAGVAPDAHLAIYKVCDDFGFCPDVSVLAGMESAMEDGVDVISFSIVSWELPLYDDPTSMASFKAFNKGVFVSAAAGNAGPTESTLANASPWIFTVGASTTDRKILAIVELSNGLKFEGQSAYQPENFTSSPIPLVYPEAESTVDIFSTYCLNATTLKTVGVEGKMVLCDAGYEDRVQMGLNVKEAGGVSMIYITSSMDGFETEAVADVIPTSAVTYSDGQMILSHYYNNPNLTARIEFLGTVIGGGSSKHAPEVASFSSRGPSLITPGFIKPDAIAPGVNILSAWPEPAFNMISGTSMSCPHLSGVATLLKSAHPNWSPAMIKSAIITTSDWTDRTSNDNNYTRYIIDEYDHHTTGFNTMGSGHVNPIKANNPGLVYDNADDDYVSYLCGLQYTDKQVSAFVGTYVACSDLKKIDGVELNYPSVVVALGDRNNYSRSFSRVVTNVGPVNCTYRVVVSPPQGAVVSVEPRRLEFFNGGRMRFSVNVRFDGKSREYSSFLEEYGYFAWVSMDGKIAVKSPIIVTKERNTHIGKY